MPELTDYDDLEIGDQFLTLDHNGQPVKYTVALKDGGDVLLLEGRGLDIFLSDGYYVVGHIDLTQEDILKALPFLANR